MTVSILLVSILLFFIFISLFDAFVLIVFRPHIAAVLSINLFSSMDLVRNVVRIVALLSIQRCSGDDFLL